MAKNLANYECVVTKICTRTVTYMFRYSPRHPVEHSACRHLSRRATVQVILSSPDAILMFVTMHTARDYLCRPIHRHTQCVDATLDAGQGRTIAISGYVPLLRSVDNTLRQSSCKVKCAMPHEEYRRGAYLPSLGREPVGG